MPEEVYEDDELVGYDPNVIHESSGAVVLIEGVLHDEDQGEQYYAKCAVFMDSFPVRLIPRLVLASC